jgi:phosphoglycerate dehydrogenase-like enzyme
MASLAKRSIKIIAFVDETFHHLLLPKIEALSPYAIVLDAGSDIEKYNPENLKEANVLLLHGHAIHAFEILYPKMPKLDWIHSCSAGVDWLFNSKFGPALRENETQVLTNAKGCYSRSLAEYMIGAMLYFEKQLPRLQQQRKERKWLPFMMNQLPGKILGIIGYGDIGQQCAALAKPFGLKIIGLRKHPENSKTDTNIEKCLPIDELDNLIPLCDYVVVTCALTPDTVGLIGKKQLSLMKESCVVINMARGPCIDENKLIEALNAGKIKGAAIDVTSKEPLPVDSKLWDISDDKLLLSPHCADQTENMVENALGMFVNKVKYYQNNFHHASVINKTTGY